MLFLTQNINGVFSIYQIFALITFKYNSYGNIKIFCSKGVTWPKATLH